MNGLDPWYESIRIYVFLTLFVIIYILEFFYSKRQLRVQRKKRLFVNLALIALSNVVLKLCLPMTLVEWAVFLSKHSWGLFSFLELNDFLRIALAILLLDLAIYFQHRFFHRNKFFWRFHQVHHADIDFDVSTGVRFHPIEIVFSLAWKMMIIAVFGMPFLAVFLFELILSSSSLWTHANFSLPQSINSILQKIFVTPDMHRIHHSTEAREYNSNF